MSGITVNRYIASWHFFAGGGLYDGAILSAVRLSPGSEPFSERAAKVKMESEAFPQIAFDKPVYLPRQSVWDALNAIGTTIDAIAKKAIEEVFGA